MSVRFLDDRRRRIINSFAGRKNRKEYPDEKGLDKHTSRKYESVLRLATVP